MDSPTLAAICDPHTRESLRLEGDALVNPRSGKHYPIRDGIPDFLLTAFGQNKKYQELYDRIATFYDWGDRIYRWLRGQKDFRRIYIDELEAPPDGQFLEVSVGTGANLQYVAAESKIFGLDLSWGMLRQCRKNLRRWRRAAELFHGEAEHLPFRNEVFDSVLHVGGINFFNDKAGAVEEMLRVAKPGTKIVIVDETEKVVKQQYKKMPIVRRYYTKRAEEVSDPRRMVSGHARDVACREIFGGRAYCLTFRKP